MKDVMRNLLVVMRDRVRENLETARINESAVRKILIEPSSNDRSQKLRKRSEFQNKILAENKENLSIQIQIVNFLTEFKETPEFKELIKSLQSHEMEYECKNEMDNDHRIKNNIREMSDNKMIHPISTSIDQPTELFDNLRIETLFERTIKGDIVFNNSHPQFNNEAFYNRVMEHFLQKEEYEICAELVKIKNG